MAQTLMRATRLAQVISVLGNEKDLETTVERAAIEVGELFFADMALLILDSDEGLRIAGHWGVARLRLAERAVCAAHGGRADECEVGAHRTGRRMPLPPWLASYSPRHVAWARLLVGDTSLGLMLLVRCGDEAFELSEANELRAVAYRIALAIENGLLHKRMTDQLAQLHRLQELTAVLAGTLELDAVGQRVADTLVSEAAVSASAVLLDRGGQLVVLSSAGSARALGIAADGDDARELDERWETFPLEVAGKTVGIVAVTGAPETGSEQHQLLLHLVSLGALSLDKALLHEQSREQARHDSLTGLLGHRVFHEVLEHQVAAARPFSVLHVRHRRLQADQRPARPSDRRSRSATGVGRAAAGDAQRRQRLPHRRRGVLRAAARAGRAGRAHGRRGRAPAGRRHRLDAAEPRHGQRRRRLLPGSRPRARRAAGERRRRALQRQALRQEPLEHGRCLLVARPRDVPARGRARSAAQEGRRHRRAQRPCCDPVRGDRARTRPRRRLLDDLRVAARLHDIGKLGVPDAILKKPGALDADEFRIVKTHTVVGAELLSSWGLPGPATIVLQHHERIDGSGYPAGLSGDEIRIESRIVHAADAYIAMIRDRPYRKAMSQEDAFDELARHSGSQFDSAVVSALIARERSRTATSRPLAA